MTSLFFFMQNFYICKNYYLSFDNFAFSGRWRVSIFTQWCKNITPQSHAWKHNCESTRCMENIWIWHLYFECWTFRSNCKIWFFINSVNNLYDYLRKYSEHLVFTFQTTFLYCLCCIQHFQRYVCDFYAIVYLLYTVQCGPGLTSF